MDPPVINMGRICYIAEICSRLPTACRVAYRDATLESGLSLAERELLVERTRAGLASARARGRHGGRPFKMTPSKLCLVQASTGRSETSGPMAKSSPPAPFSSTALAHAAITGLWVDRARRWQGLAARKAPSRRPGRRNASLPQRLVVLRHMRSSRSRDTVRQGNRQR